MTSTRSLLCEAVTASWIDLYWQCLRSLMLKPRSFLTFFFFSLIGGWEGRSVSPFFCAFFRSLFRAFIDLFLESCLVVPCFLSFLLGTCEQTTRVLPGFFVLSALKTLRTAGTDPPAAGFTDVSGPGSGQ